MISKLLPIPFLKNKVATESAGAWTAWHFQSGVVAHHDGTAAIALNYVEPVASTPNNADAGTP
jgi:hypothetical protein